MPHVRVELLLSVDGLEPAQAALEEDVPTTPETDGMQFFIEESVAHLRQELLYDKYIEESPQVEDLLPESTKITLSLEDFFTGKRESVMNKRELWRFVGNNALAVRLWLAKARAFHDVQGSLPASRQRLRWMLHHEKMDKLHHAVHGIANLRDIHLRIVAEALGYTRFQIRRRNGTHRKKIALKSLSQLLERRNKFKPLRELPEAEIKALQGVAARLRKGATADTRKFLDYRNRLVHQESPIVDYPSLYPQLEDRAWEPIIRNGKRVGQTKSVPAGVSSPEWEFETLHAVVLAAFKHYADTLRMLWSISVFAP